MHACDIDMQSVLPDQFSNFVHKHNHTCSLTLLDVLAKVVVYITASAVGASWACDAHKCAL